MNLSERYDFGVYIDQFDYAHPNIALLYLSNQFRRRRHFPVTVLLCNLCHYVHVLLKTMIFRPPGPFVEVFTNKGRGHDALCACKEKASMVFFFLIYGFGSPTSPLRRFPKKKRCVEKRCVETCRSGFFRGAILKE